MLNHGKANVPRLIFWELTKRCNLNCIHCRAEAEDIDFSGELDLGTIKKVIDDITTEYSPILVLTGGEPLYRNDIFDIVSYAVSKNLKVALATNGTLIDREVAGRIKDSGISRVSISIDGSYAKSHDSFRGIEGSFDRALQGAAFLREQGVEFQINTTLTKRNISELEDLLKLAISHGAVALHLFMLVPVGCGVQIAESEMISPEKYEEILTWFYKKSREIDLEFKATCAPHYYRIIRQRAAQEGRTISFATDGMAAMTRGCLAGTGVCFISHRGDVQPCGYLPVFAGNVTETSFSSIWKDSDLFRHLRDFNSLKGKCGLCEYKALCGGCRARAYYSHGDYMEEEPYCLYTPARSSK
ncbi:MAG TPA: radical SAM protein [Spirochaetota bacterium]|jgi:heme b synthase|nr:MAG: Antilisterial bacteriocin subtilosin biosynthesis protein AlbA [Spirochaetes bacterium ADurb.Bin218]HOK02885.1 radical SAM protein [Spirochaetota bacterium]HOK92366.1 radical SAM protein [Spirochaetota bacterium]HOV09380.1 radical SAM protein [Spirochaetota bacterium]HPP94891.1 radical SAM protein [Spirochaetota bacterium]